MQLILNGIKLQFKGEIDFRINSPIFSEQRTFTFNFKLADTPENDLAMGFAKFPDVITEQVKYKNCFLTSALIEYRGTLTLTDVEAGFYNVNFVAEYFQGEVKNYALSSYEKIYYTALTPALANRVNDYDCLFSPIFYSNIDTSDIGNYQFGGGDLKIPTFYLKKLINSILDKYGITAIYELGDITEDFNDLMLANNCSIDYFRLDKNGYPLLYVTNYGYNYSNEEGDPYNELIFEVYRNSPVLGTFPEEITIYCHSDDTTFPLHDKFYTIQFLRILPLEDPDAIEYALYKLKNAEIEDLSTYWVGADISFNNAPTIKSTSTSFNAKNHLPKITMGELIKAIEDKYCLKFIFDDTFKTCRVIKLKNMLFDNFSVSISTTQNKKLTPRSVASVYAGFQSPSDEYYNSTIRQTDKRHNEKEPVTNFTDLPADAENNDLRLVTADNARYEYIANAWNVRQESGVEGSWQFWSYNILMSPVENADYKLESKASPLSPIQKSVVSYLTNPDEVLQGADPIVKKGWYLNCCNGTPVYFADRKTDNDFKDVRLFFYRGYENYIDNFNIPHVVVSDKDAWGNKLEYANLSLDFTSENSIWNRCSKEWVQWYASRKELEVIIQWPAHLLHNFDFTKKYEINGDLYFVKSISVKIDHNDNLKFGVTELVKV